MRIAVFIALAGLAAAAPGGAQTDKQVEARHSREYHRCLNTGDAIKGATYAMLECTWQETDRQDARLNQAYRMVTARLGARDKAVLRLSERRWIRRRDPGCSKKTDDGYGDDMSRLGDAACILDETIKRTIWLERYKG